MFKRITISLLCLGLLVCIAFMGVKPAQAHIQLSSHVSQSPLSTAYTLIARDESPTDAPPDVPDQNTYQTEDQTTYPYVEAS